jgi:hypothetical protein
LPKQYDGYEEFMAMFNISAKDKHSGWKFKVGQKKFKDGMMCEFYQRKQLNNSNDMIRVESRFIGITKEDIANYWLDPPVDKHSGIKDYRIV